MAIEGNRIGPFIGGLNTASDATSVGDTDLVVLENMELDLDGSIVSRPPIVNLNKDIPAPSSGTGGLNLLGYFSPTAGTNYLIANNNEHTFYFDGTTWTKICDFPATAITQYRDKLWLVSPIGHTKPGGSWVPGTFTEVAAMPRGSSIVAHKERLWITGGTGPNSSRLNYSDVGEPDKWPGNFVNISAGDGQDCVALFLYFNDILIFKTRSTYRFAYATSPDTGVVSVISGSVGAATTDAVTAYENNLYVVYSDKVYEVTNFNFNQVNNKVPLDPPTPDFGMSMPVSVSVWLDRLFVQYYGTVYVLDLKTNTWSIWTSKIPNFRIGKVLSFPIDILNKRPFAYIAGGSANDRRLFRVDETLSFGNAEQIECVVQTKNYDFQSSHTFKRMTYWGFDVILRGDVEATVFPIVHAVLPTWAQLATVTWNDLIDKSWSRPFDIRLDVTDSLNASGALGDRKFIKALKSLRFRQIAFRLKFTIDGTPATSPVKLFNITSFVGVKERVSKKVS